MNQFFIKIALVATLVLASTLTLSCSSNSDNSGTSGNTSTTYCVVESMGICAIGLTGKQCKEGYKGHEGYSDTECPSGYDKLTVSGNGSGTVTPSSSSWQQSSSSVTSSVCTAANNTSTQYCSNGTMKTYGSVTDDGGQIYKTIVIGTQTWMAENLNYNVSGSKCGNGSSLSNANTATCNTYGRLYDWATAMALDASCNSTSCSGQIKTKHQGICPDGWHIPSDADWDKLMVAVGGEATAGKYLKATSGWDDYIGVAVVSGNGVDKYGFSALPGGSGDYSGDSFGDVGSSGEWWSSTEHDADSAYSRYMRYISVSVYNYDYGRKSRLLSVRCLQD